MMTHTNAELREMMERATPGRWQPVSEGDDNWSVGYVKDDRIHFITDSPEEEDARLIAAMHTELPRLLAESEELQQEQAGIVDWRKIARDYRSGIATRDLEILALHKQLASRFRVEDCTFIGEGVTTDRDRFYLRNRDIAPCGTIESLREQLAAKTKEASYLAGCVSRANCQLTASTERANRILEDAKVLRDELDKKLTHWLRLRGANEHHAVIEGTELQVSIHTAKAEMLTLCRLDLIEVMNDSRILALTKEGA